ncbi:pyridoxal-phosphate dependent enzyme [Candidatus Bathyarchaeota archaeon]|nr:pyridoxal-phosphate dependent enzyme [Candidatus Bathyarchaeota archaeon]
MVNTFVNGLTKFVGNTPLIEVSKVFGARNPLHVDLSYMNPSGSIKDLPVLNILRHLQKTGELQKHGGIIEVTSGNTGIALSYWANALQVRAVVIMPKGMSKERKKMMELLGADVMEKGRDFEEAREHAKYLAHKENLIYLGQFSRDQNPQAYNVLAKKILKKKVKYVVAGVGTGGTLMGLAGVLKPKGVRVIAVFPKEKKHGIQGIGDGIFGSFYKPELVDEEFRVSTKEAQSFMRELWTNGFLVGRSSGANLIAALSYSENGSVATVFPDSWDRYFSVEDKHINFISGGLR